MQPHPVDAEAEALAVERHGRREVGVGEGGEGQGMVGAQEVPVAVKTQPARYAEVEAAIRARHPYELPEILAVPVVDGLAPYLKWIADETATA